MTPLYIESLKCIEFATASERPTNTNRVKHPSFNLARRSSPRKLSDPSATRQSGARRGQSLLPIWNPPAQSP